MGAMMGSTVGLIIGFIFGATNIIRYGPGPNGMMRTLGQYMLGSAATFGYIQSPNENYFWEQVLIMEIQMLHVHRHNDTNGELAHHDGSVPESASEAWEAGRDAV